VLDPQKHYLMVGALGGLGRSVSKWMQARGAQYFTFLNRSGLDKEEARSLAADLESNGACVHVVRGSVDVLEDVQRAVAETQGPIGGVIHAAMGLAESLFASMTWEQWNKAIRPKVQGTWNLHHSLRDHESALDFFLLTSSISGSVGTATESNYCAANSFQDAFARYRRSLGLKAVAVGLGMISEVGYLHEHPDIEKLLLRKGIHPINEDELSQIIDIAIALESRTLSGQPRGGNGTSIQNGHLLTGMELVDLEGQRKHGFEGHSHILDDPRSSLLAYNFERQSVLFSEGGRAGGGASGLDVQAASEEELRGAAGEIVANKIANLVLVKADELQSTTRLSEFSMDSMLAAEFRGHVFNVLRVDIPFMTILGPATTVGSLTELVVEGLLKQKEGAGS
jgi:NAD(P)-dependent dehydrogenase (short-subunit alcohol dehydrogenase family)